LAITAAICRIHDIQEGSITIGLDGYEDLQAAAGYQALQAATGNWPLNPERPNFDLIMDIRAKIKKLPISVKWKWVKGHQDNNPSLTLDKWVKANIMTDNMTKASWNHLNQTGHVASPQQFGDKGWALYFHDRKLNRVVSCTGREFLMSSL
jgi:ribonuclease HI